MNDENNNLDISFIDNLNINSPTLNIVNNFHIDPMPSYCKEINLSKNKNIIQDSFEPTFKKIFDLGAKNMNDEGNFDEKENEYEIKYMYEFFGKEDEEKDKDKNSSSKTSTENEKKFKNENHVIKTLTNFINEYEYKKLYKELLKIKIYLQKKCDRKKFIKANENYLPILLKKKVKEIFELENILKENFPSNEEEKKINELLESTIEDELKLYYFSNELEQFKKKKYRYGKTPEDYDKIFYNGRKGKERGYYLLEPFGLITYANSEPYCKNKRKKNIK